MIHFFTAKAKNPKIQELFMSLYLTIKILFSSSFENGVCAISRKKTQIKNMKGKKVRSPHTVLRKPQEVKKNLPFDWLVPLESTHLKLSDKPKIKILYVSKLEKISILIDS